jgi:nitroreductase
MDVLLGFDNDAPDRLGHRAGDAAAERLAEQLWDVGAEPRRARPSLKDWHAVLCARGRAGVWLALGNPQLWDRHLAAAAAQPATWVRMLVAHAGAEPSMVLGSAAAPWPAQLGHGARPSREPQAPPGSYRGITRREAMDLTDAMRTTAATRAFRPDPVPDDVLYRVLDSARFAASGGNRQGWRVIVVREPALRTALRDLYLRSWRPTYARLVEQAADDARRRHLARAHAYGEHLEQVPVHLVVAVELAALTTGMPLLDESRFVGGASIYPFVQNVILALRAEGLGSALTMLLNNHEPEVKRLLALPDGIALAAHLGVGWPARPLPTRLQRRPVEEFATLDRYGGEPLRPAARG